MSAPHVPERRRSPRVFVPDEHCVLQIRTPVRLLDISANGALVASEIALPAGATGQLRFALAGNSYAPAIVVRRRTGEGGRELGSLFVSLDEKSRRRLEEFLKSAMP